jgi:hypothetical protein
MSLDLAGLVPLIGEVADLANGVIYTIEGDGVNASLSFAATIPVGGMWVTFSKYASKLVIAVDGTRRTLKWIKRADGIIEFGDRRLMRKILGLASGDPRIAHHIIPWGEGSHRAIQKAASNSSNNVFHLNKLLNGIPLNPAIHTGNHAAYSIRVRTRLDAIPTSLSPDETTIEIERIINDIRTAIINNPNTNIDNLIF